MFSFSFSALVASEQVKKKKKLTVQDLLSTQLGAETVRKLINAVEHLAANREC